jgi:hypothetical protein
LDAAVTVQPLLAAAVALAEAGALVAGAPVGAAVVVAVGDAVASEALPPHAASHNEAAMSVRAWRRRIVTKECPKGKSKG